MRCAATDVRVEWVLVESSRDATCARGDVL